MKRLPFKKKFFFFWTFKVRCVLTPFFYVLGNGYNLLQFAGVPFFRDGEGQCFGIIFSFASQGLKSEYSS